MTPLGGSDYCSDRRCYYYYMRARIYYILYGTPSPTAPIRHVIHSASTTARPTIDATTPRVYVLYIDSARLIFGTTTPDGDVGSIGGGWGTGKVAFICSVGPSNNTPPPLHPLEYYDYTHYYYAFIQSTVCRYII